MRKKSFLEKIAANRRHEKKLLIQRALRGAAQPWSVEVIALAFSRVTNKRDRITLFNKNISHIFPVILDLTASGLSFPQIEKTLGLTDRMLWRWLKVRGPLMEEVRKARELIGSRVLSDWEDEAP